MNQRKILNGLFLFCLILGLIFPASSIGKTNEKEVIESKCQVIEQTAPEADHNVTVGSTDVYLDDVKVDEVDCSSLEQYDFPNSGPENWYEDPANLFYVFASLAFLGLTGFIFWSYRHFSLRESIKIPVFLLFFSFIWIGTVFRDFPELYVFLIGTIVLPLSLIYISVRDSDKPYKKRIMIGSLLFAIFIVDLLLIFFTSTTPA